MRIGVSGVQPEANGGLDRMRKAKERSVFSLREPLFAGLGEFCRDQRGQKIAARQRSRRLAPSSPTGC